MLVLVLEEICQVRRPPRTAGCRNRGTTAYGRIAIYITPQRFDCFSIFSQLLLLRFWYSLLSYVVADHVCCILRSTRASHQDLYVDPTELDCQGKHLFCHACIHDFLTSEACTNKCPVCATHISVEKRTNVLRAGCVRDRVQRLMLSARVHVG